MINADAARPTRKSRSAPVEPIQPIDPTDTRARLLHAALRLFAEQGFAPTSTREIGLAAGVNIAAISYYFGDKAGLYRAVFTEPLGNPTDNIALYDDAGLTLRQSLYGFFSSLLAPMKQGNLMQLCTRLHFREMLEPSGVWAERIDSGIKPAHAALVKMLGRHLGVVRADDALHRLAFSVAGLALQIFFTRDVIDAIRPKLLSNSAAIDHWIDSMIDFAAAMVAVEAQRRSRLKKSTGKPA
jgi:AcrR family transcriptional regulator